MQFEDLTKEQQDVINLACGKYNVFVDACIGSGKTTTINILCKEYIKNYPDNYIVYLTYSNLLKCDAQEKIGNGPNIYVTNYHSYARRYISKSYNGAVADYINQFVIENPITPAIDLLILDEYQDITTDISNMLCLIKKNNPGLQIVAVGDMHQRIYDNTNLNVKEFIKDFLGNYIQKTFTYCFRLNEEYASRIGEIWNKTIHGVNPDCTIRIMTIDETYDYLKDKPIGDILVLGKQSNGISSALLNKLESSLPEKFNKNTVFVKDKHNDHVKITAKNMNDITIFTTYDGSKGMEKPICVITDFNKQYIEGRIAMGTEPNRMKNISCVAMSRGKKTIIFVQPTEKELRYESLNFDPKNRLLIKDKLLADLKPGFVIPNRIDVFQIVAYKYNENVNKCFNMITKTHIKCLDETIIQHKENYGYISLSKHSMPFILANFFKNYNIEEETEIMTAKYGSVIPDWMNPKTIDEYTRVMAFIKTGQIRYYTQVPNLNFTQDDVTTINERLASIFTGDETFIHPIDCNLSDIIDLNLLTKLLPHNISKEDLNDTIEKLEDMPLIFSTYLMTEDTYYSLIFDANENNKTSNSTTMRDAMIEALFVGLLFGMQKIKIWNIQTNQMYELSTPDKNKFIANVICTYLNLTLPY